MSDRLTADTAAPLLHYFELDDHVVILMFDVVAVDHVLPPEVFGFFDYVPSEPSNSTCYLQIEVSLHSHLLGGRKPARPFYDLVLELNLETDGECQVRG